MEKESEDPFQRGGEKLGSSVCPENVGWGKLSTYVPISMGGMKNECKGAFQTDEEQAELELLDELLSSQNSYEESWRLSAWRVGRGSVLLLEFPPNCLRPTCLCCQPVSCSNWTEARFRAFGLHTSQINFSMVLVVQLLD